MILLWRLLREINPAYLETWRVLNLKITAIWWERVIVVAMIGFFFAGMSALSSPDPMPFVLLTGLIVSLLFVVGVGWAITTTKQRGCYDLICVTNRGRVGTDWTIAALFTKESLKFIPLQVIISVVPGILLLYGIGKLMDDLSSPIIGGNLLSLSVLLPLDCMYSVVIGTLAGIMGAMYSIWVGIALLVAIQAVTYILYGAVSMWIFRSHGFIEWAILTVIVLAGYVVLREITVRVLWLGTGMTHEELLDFQQQVK